MKNKKQFIIISIFAMMFLVAMVDNVRGLFIPEFEKSFTVNDTYMGFLIFICSLGYVIATYTGGILCEKLTQKKVFILGFLTVIISLLSIYFARTYYLLLISLFLMNLGEAWLCIAANTLIPVLFNKGQAIFMNMMHFCYGVGATFTPWVTGIMLNRGMSWVNIYLIICIYAIISFIPFIFIKIPSISKAKMQKKFSRKEAFKNKIIYYYIFGLGFYVIAEVGTGNWLINYLIKYYKFDSIKGSHYLTLFFGLFALGRLLGGFIVERFGYLNTVVRSIFIAFLLYISGLIIGSNGLILIPISGFFLSIVFPTVILTINKIFPEHSYYITGLVVTLTSLICMILNFVIGRLNDVIGVYGSYYVIPISMFIGLVFLYKLHIESKKYELRGNRDVTV